LKSDAKDLTHVAPTGQAPGDQRSLAGTTGKISGTTGEPFGMTGEERLWMGRAWLLGIALVAAIAFVNVLTIQHDAPRTGRPETGDLGDQQRSGHVRDLLHSGRHGVLDGAGSSALVAGAARAYCRRADSIRSCTSRASSPCASSVMRRCIHERYQFGPLSTEFPYEFRKDMMSYGLATIIFWLALRRSGQALAQAPAPTAPATFDILDGARLIRVPVPEILAVRSAGNYVEFVLADDRRPLMRSSLSAVSEQLADQGFVRSHKSWLVNKARVTGLKPEGSGDYAIELGPLEVPLSRRFPEALAVLAARAASPSGCRPRTGRRAAGPRASCRPSCWKPSRS
jgi:predicted outer membrane lipoprotein